MRAEELRGGNWIKIRPKNSDKPWRYIQVDSSVLAVLEGKRESHFEYAPIPITEEILLKAGFEYYGENNGANPMILYKRYFDFAIYPPCHFYREKHWHLSVHESIVGNKSLNILYVHQLQNLYFAVTEAELNIYLNTDKK